MKSGSFLNSKYYHHYNLCWLPLETLQARTQILLNIKASSTSFVGKTYL